LSIIDFGPCTIDHTIFFLAVAVRKGTLDVHPLAFVPQTTLHLAALGHLEAVERVAVTPEKACNKVVLAAELASSKIELLPPILMIAVLESEGSLIGCITFDWASTLAISKVVESITSSITLDSCEQEVFTAGGPSPLVHGTSPVRDILETSCRGRAEGTIVEGTVLTIAGADTSNLVAGSMVTAVTNAALVRA
jgi:hypothetical protein